MTLSLPDNENINFSHRVRAVGCFQSKCFSFYISFFYFISSCWQQRNDLANEHTKQSGTVIILIWERASAKQHKTSLVSDVRARMFVRGSRFFLPSVIFPAVVHFLKLAKIPSNIKFRRINIRDVHDRFFKMGDDL